MLVQMVGSKYDHSQLNTCILFSKSIIKSVTIKNHVRLNPSLPVDIKPVFTNSDIYFISFYQFWNEM